MTLDEVAQRCPVTQIAMIRCDQSVERVEHYLMRCQVRCISTRRRMGVRFNPKKNISINLVRKEDIMQPPLLRDVRSAVGAVDRTVRMMRARELRRVYRTHIESMILNNSADLIKYSFYSTCSRIVAAIVFIRTIILHIQDVAHSK